MHESGIVMAFGRRPIMDPATHSGPVYGDLRAVRRGIMVPSAGRGSSRGIDDAEEAESGGRDWGTIGGIEWAK